MRVQTVQQHVHPLLCFCNVSLNKTNSQPLNPVLSITSEMRLYVSYKQHLGYINNPANEIDFPSRSSNSDHSWVPHMEY